MSVHMVCNRMYLEVLAQHPYLTDVTLEEAGDNSGVGFIRGLSEKMKSKNKNLIFNIITAHTTGHF